MQQTPLLSRRAFLGQSATVIVALSFFGFGSAACRSEKRVIGDMVIQDGEILLDLDKESFFALRRPGQGVSITIEQRRKPLLVTRINESEVAALSSRCTHAGYTVLPPENGVLVCSSGHGGEYALDGTVLHGPPASSLRRFPCRLEGNMIVIDYSGASDER